MRIAIVAAFAAGALVAQNQNPPLNVPAGVEVQRDIEYANVDGKSLKLDLFLPAGGGAARPAVVYIHGGGWRNGSRLAFQRQAARMAAIGFVGACIQYRLSGEAIYPAALHDSKSAVRWLRANAKKYNVDGNRIGAAGGSAGGHLAALLAVTNGRAEYEGKVGVTGPSSAVQAVAAFNPAVDFGDFGDRAGENARNSVSLFLGKTFAEDEALWKSASPVELVTAKAPPFLFLHGTGDKTVPFAQSEKMAALLKKAGVRAEMMSAPGAGHGFFNTPPWFQPTLDRMEQFFVDVLKSKASR